MNKKIDIDEQKYNEIVQRVRETYHKNETKEDTANKITTIDENSDDKHYPTAKAVFNLMEENMINTTDLENGLENLSTTNSNISTNLGTKINELTVAVRGIGADFTQVDASASDVKSGKTFFDDQGILQTGTIPTFDGETTITENGTVETTGKFMESDLTVAVPRPQLNAPTLSLDGDVLTITNPASNGDYVESYEIYANGELIFNSTETTINLSNFLISSGTYSLTSTCCSDLCIKSLPSASVNYSIEQNTIFTNVTQITSLLNDYQSEENFNTSTEEKLQFGTLLGNLPCAKIWFRQKPTNLSNEQIDLQFFISGLTNPTAIPALIKLNGTTVFNGDLTLVSGQDYVATCTINITSGFMPFNELTIEFTDPNQATAYLDYVNISITGTQNCIVLNRSNQFDLYSIKRTNGNKREYARHYENGGGCYFIGGDFVDFTQTLPNQSFRTTIINNVPLRYGHASHSHAINNSGVYTFSSGFRYDILITQNNDLYCDDTSFTKYNTHGLTNVNYAKQSVFNGSLSSLNYICCSFFDYSVALSLPISEGTYHLTSTTPVKLNNQVLRSEFIDFIPINDYFFVERTSKINCGYLLLHKSGNILFINDANASYGINIGKGRQINAYLQQDANTINIYYNQNNSVIQKQLKRIDASSDWTLHTITTFDNAKEIYESGNSSMIKIYNSSISYI